MRGVSGEGSGASPDGDRAATASQPSPSVSGGADIPSAEAWRLDSPPYGKRPIWQYVWLQGESYHDGDLWFRHGWGTAAIRTNHAADGLFGYRRADIERICRDNDIDLWTARVVAWLPMAPPALLNCGMRPPLALCEDGEWSASAIEARRVETQSGSIHESAIPQGDAPIISPNPKD